MSDRSMQIHLLSDDARLQDYLTSVCRVHRAYREQRGVED